MQAPTASSAAAILAQLRDVHIPEAPGWWPPAVGWWLIFFAVVIPASIFAHRWLKHRRQNQCPAWHALNALDDLWDEYESERDASRTVQQISALMRRTAMSLDKRAEVAALTGDAWLEWLDRHAPGKLFTDSGRPLAEAPYRRASPAEVESLFEACETWLEYNVNMRTLDDEAAQDHVSV